jgi:hypothetical protein
MFTTLQTIDFTFYNTNSETVILMAKRIKLLIEQKRNIYVILHAYIWRWSAKPETLVSLIWYCGMLTRC